MKAKCAKGSCGYEFNVSNRLSPKVGRDDFVKERRRGEYNYTRCPLCGGKCVSMKYKKPIRLSY